MILSNCVLKGGDKVSHRKVTIKKVLLYLIGLFFLSLGVSFSIQADLGVSPVSSLAYAFSLSFHFSVGLMTVVTNIIFIITQIILSRQFELRDAIVQLIVAFLFGFFIDITLLLLQLFPTPETLVMKFVFLLCSFIIIPIGLLFYFTPQFPLMPYDQLTHVISETFKLKLSKAKIIGDLLNVVIAAIVCLVFVQSLGSVGIGTLLAAYFVGKNLGLIAHHFREYLLLWLNDEENIFSKTMIDNIKKKASEKKREEVYLKQASNTLK